MGGGDGGHWGAEIVTHGVPSQPGNMTLVAYLDDTPILGVPGAAISMPTTIFDVLLPFDMVGRQAEIKQASQDAIHSDTHQYFTVINFDLDLAGKNRKDF